MFSGPVLRFSLVSLPLRARNAAPQPPRLKFDSDLCDVEPFSSLPATSSLWLDELSPQLRKLGLDDPQVVLRGLSPTRRGGAAWYVSLSKQVTVPGFSGTMDARSVRVYCASGYRRLKYPAELGAGLPTKPTALHPHLVLLRPSIFMLEICDLLQHVRHGVCS